MSKNHEINTSRVPEQNTRGSWRASRVLRFATLKQVIIVPYFKRSEKRYEKRNWCGVF